MSVVLSARVPDAIAVGFDLASATRGGRSALLHTLIRDAVIAGGGAAPAVKVPRSALRVMVRLGPSEAGHVRAQADAMGLPKSTWMAALVAAHARRAPRFARPEELALIAIQSELRRVGVNINQIARALNTAVMEGRVLETELGAIDDFRHELRAHVRALGDAFAGNLTYWAVDL